MKRFLLFVFFFSSYQLLNAQEKSIVPGMKITSNVKIKKGVYKLDAPIDLKKSLILVEGKNIVLDFAGVTLNGSNKVKLPNEFFGTAILIQNSSGITIKNLKAKGFKIALLAKNVTNLVLDNCDFSYNYRPQLNSTQEKEDISDWMSYHHNEKDEWMRYGAGIYLKDCEKAEIKNCLVTGGQNALMMTNCNKGKIYNNNFSFNSGIGIGMYRSSYNEIAYNKIDFNVRGYSHGVYNRGQDSAGILVYEQSNNNSFVYNSATHSGDGFFLWAGQTTMDSGQGGCNDNIIAWNDFSYAPTNGIEVTFSRNKIQGNRIFECDHGIWGGYSYDTWIEGNKFRNNRIAIAIEHGQDNKISMNLFADDKEAIKLWARKEQPADWGYAKNRNTRSRNYEIFLNSFNNIPLVYNLNMTRGIKIYGNTYSKTEQLFKVDSTVTGIDSTDREYSGMDTFIPPDIQPSQDPFKGMGKLAGRKNMMITEWGPYDFKYPIIWNTNPTDKGDTMKFKLFAPAGKWKIVGSRGISDVSKMSGNFPDSILVVKEKSGLTDIKMDVEYSGPAITTVFGEKAGGSKPYRFTFQKYFKPINWEVRFFSLDTNSHNPITTGELFSPTERKAPVKMETKDRLEYAWWGGIKAENNQQYPRFITMAEAKTVFAPGDYEFSLTWDDAVRVYLDDKLVLNEWQPSKYTFDESPHRKFRLRLDGIHLLRVEHVELGGFATLALKIKPVQ